MTSKKLSLASVIKSINATDSPVQGEDISLHRTWNMISAVISSHMEEFISISLGAVVFPAVFARFSKYLASKAGHKLGH